MEASFWHNLWEKNLTGWHLDSANPFLIEFFSRLELSSSSRVFIPLCGKTIDIKWILDKGYRVAGAELNENAIKELFISLSLKPIIKKIGKFKLYSAENIDIFVGDIFDLSKETLGDIDAIYDRAALVALPKEMRLQYVSLLKNIAKSKPKLLINYEYEQKLYGGPPFSIAKKEIEEHYGELYTIKLLKSFKIEDGPFKELMAYENIWLLS